MQVRQQTGNQSGVYATYPMAAGISFSPQQLWTGYGPMDEWIDGWNAQTKKLMTVVKIWELWRPLYSLDQSVPYRCATHREKHYSYKDGNIPS